MLLNPVPILNHSIFVSGVHDLTQNAILHTLEAKIGEKFGTEFVHTKAVKREAEEALEGRLGRAVSMRMRWLGLRGLVLERRLGVFWRGWGRD